MTRVDRGAPATRKTARGRLIVQRPAPRGWVPGWTPANPVRRCGCGAPVVVRASRYSRCERGCTRLVAAPRPAPAPPPPAGYTRLLRSLRLLEQRFASASRKGRRPGAHAVEIALESVAVLKVAHPSRAEEIVRLLPWLSRAGAQAPAVQRGGVAAA